MIELIGHSGCELDIIDIGNKLVVHKQSKNLEYNDRLKAQCLKQRDYKSNVFQTVQVTDYGYNQKGLFYFNMEYISGITIAEYMKDISLSEIDTIARTLHKCIDHDQIYDINAEYIFKNKVSSLRKAIIYQDSTIDKAFNILNNFSWKYIVKSSCHGDFTLENMILSNGCIYLIDFLDSFYDSWMIDFAKLLQDVELYWHYRFDTTMDNNLILRLLILKENIINYILDLPNGDNLVITIYHILLLNVLRIIPYTKDDFTLNYLLDKIKYIVEKININKWR